MINMAKIIICMVGILVSITSACYAQVTYNYGFKAGYNLATQYGVKDQGKAYQVNSSFRSGISTGLELDFNITPNLILGYELLYSMKGSKQDITIREIDGELLIKPAVMHVKYYLDYIDVPVLLKFNILNKPSLKLQAITGSSFSLKIKGQYDLNGTVYFPDGDTISVFYIKDTSDLKEINQFDFSFIYGGKLLFPQLKFPLFLEYRFTLGWDYLDLPTYADLERVELRNQTYSLIIGVQL